MRGLTAADRSTMNTRIMHRLPVAVVLQLVLAAACAPASQVSRPVTRVVAPHETLNAALWMQQSAEYRSATIQAYRTAGLRLRQALADTSWSALPDQRSAGRRPAAVILDVDETVLDNSAFQAGVIVRDTTYSRDLWNAWVLEERAGPVPGALEFTQSADSAGVRVFYVTNRSSELEDATVNNLRSLGFPVAEDVDVVLTRGEEGWTGDKAARRGHVAAGHRVLLLVGDDLNDFVAAEALSATDRMSLTEAASTRWGKQWIILPNPVYGSWERTANGGTRSRSEQIRAKTRALRTR